MRYKTEFVKSCNNHADFLSRLPLENSVEDFQDDFGSEFVSFIVEGTQLDLSSVKEATAMDSLLQLVCSHLRQGWPKSMKREIK